MAEKERLRQLYHLKLREQMSEKERLEVGNLGAHDPYELLKNDAVKRQSSIESKTESGTHRIHHINHSVN